jgi:hypothetical protein
MSTTLNNTPELNESQLQENYEYFIEFVKASFKGERLETLLHMYSESELGAELVMAPASTKTSYHCAWSGGYIQHVMHVEKASRGVQSLYKAIGGTIDYTDEERTFAALHHDLGKLGDETGAQYVPNDSEWHIKNRGEIYKINPKIQFLRVPDRALYMLQRYNVKTTLKEMLAIKLADGLYDDAAKDYFKTYDPEKGLKNNLPYIIHTADLLACHAESDALKNSKE